MFTGVRNPPNRYHASFVEWDEPPTARLQIIEERSRSILAHNNSPDVGFDWSLNPYRGCTHACAYCYARAFHERLDLGAGSDFERVLHVKRQAPALLEETFLKPSWKGELIGVSGATDCYQPIERRFGLTRACLEVCARFRNPVHIVTRSPLVTRDLDVLAELAEWGGVGVSVSMPLPDEGLRRALEPGTAPIEARLRAVRALADAGVPVGVSLMPLIPGLNDALLPQGLRAAREAGARWAWTGMLRLDPPVAAVFEERLREALPDRAERVMAAVRRSRGGALNDARFVDRMRGQGAAWDASLAMFRLWRDKLGFGAPPPAPDSFRRPTAQLGLFG